jgi:hypothetical protein
MNYIINQQLLPQVEKYKTDLEAHALQLLENLEDTHEDFTAQIAQHANTVIPNTRTSSSIFDKPIAPRFAHVNLSGPTLSSTPATDSYFPPTTTNKADKIHRDQWGRLSHTTQDSTSRIIPGQTPRPVVPLNHTHFIHRAQFQYTGNPFTFYKQLFNSAHQYGIYLVALDQVKWNESLCPASHNGHLFTDTEYKAMAATLYEKLARTDVIGSEYTAL